MMRLPRFARNDKENHFAGISSNVLIFTIHKIFLNPYTILKWKSIGKIIRDNIFAGKMTHTDMLNISQRFLQVIFIIKYY